MIDYTAKGLTVCVCIYIYIQLTYHLKKLKEVQLDSSPMVHQGQESQDHPYVMDLKFVL